MRIRRLSTLFAIGLMVAGLSHAQQVGRRAVVVTVQNLAPAGGTYQSPIWIGFHDGGFDLYDLGMASSEALERIAEDGDTAALNALFATMMPDGIQTTVAANGMMPPLAPGQLASRIFELDPSDPNTRYFSFASMVLPSNDTFVGNDSPVAHPIYNDRGRFVAEGFTVAGPGGAIDAGTEANDELPANTAFLGQSVANSGDDELGVVHTASGFNAVGSGGVLDEPQFAHADYTEVRYNLLAFRFHLIDLGGSTTFAGRLSVQQEIPAPIVERRPGGGKIRLQLLSDGDGLSFRIETRSLSGPITGAHLHLAPAGQTGPVVVDLLALRDRDRRRFVGTITPDDVMGVLGDADRPFSALLAELASGAIYVNVHTELNPAGEIRGQLFPGPRGVVRIEAMDDGEGPPLLPGGRIPDDLQNR
ncbi:MAG: spondin domain-containing protein [Acidobacteriota bacterium]|nr:spondin domain-containing protein [Acidobacteriota bacterium]MDH3784514.1 spondin domain-containing protein [Acidobacteriota bacterium]